MRTNSSVIKENVLAVLIALVLSFWIVFFISKVDFLKADIAGSKKNSTQMMLSDFIVERSSTGLVVVSNRKFDTVQSVIVNLSYDPSKVKLNDDNVENDNVALTLVDTWEIEILIQWVNQIKKGEPVLKLKDVDWKYVNVGNIVVSFTDGTLAQNFQITTK